MLCVLILYISGETYSSNSIPNAGFFEKLYMANLFTLREEIAAEIFLHFAFWWTCLTWGLERGLTYNKPTQTHYLLNYGDFIADHLFTMLLLKWKRPNVV